jgi:hypothetical protein
MFKNTTKNQNTTQILKSNPKKIIFLHNFFRVYRRKIILLLHWENRSADKVI